MDNSALINQPKIKILVLLDWMKQLRKWGIQITHEPQQEKLPNECKEEACARALQSFLESINHEYINEEDKNICKEFAPLLNEICEYYKERNKEE